MSRYPANIITKSPATPTGPNPITGRAPGVWRMEDVAYWLKQGVWPDASADGYWPYTSLLLSSTSLSNANNNLFVDSSGAFNPVSRNGNTAQGSFTPYGSYWSNYFAGAGSYLQTPANSATTIVGTLSSTANLTIECWIFPTAYNSSANFPGLIGDMVATAENNNWSWGITNTGTLMLYWNISGTQYRASTTSTVSLNTWTHIALNVAAGAITMYINGVSQTLTGTTTLGTPSGSNNYLVIGQWNNGSGGTGGTSHGLYTGYISNLRVVKASTYTSNFTPQTSPLTAITSTSLLTCQSNRFIDNSSNALALTVAGSMAVQKFSPFTLAAPGVSYNQSDITNWSGYFDGSGDYLTTPSSSAFALPGDFTIEMWIYFTGTPQGAGPSKEYFYSTTNNGGIAFLITGTQLKVSQTGVGDDLTVSYTTASGQWYHFAITRSSGTMAIFVNGARVGSGSVSTSYPTSALQTATNNNGYLSNWRIVKGTAVYNPASTTITVPTAPLTAISGTSLLTLQNAAFTDNSTNNFVITPYGNATVSGNSPFNTTGYWSNYANSGYLSWTNSTGLGSNNFTIEFWGLDISGSGNWGIFSIGATSGADFAGITLAQNGGVYISTTGSSWQYTNIGGLTFSTDGQWHHYAIVRNGGSLLTFKDGTLVATTAISGSLVNNSGHCRIASKSDASGSTSGYFSNFRVVNGTALYTASFTVPTAPLTAVTNTAILTCQNGSFKDNSSNAFAITVNGSPQVQPYNPFYTSTIASNGGSMYFDGSGDYLQVPSSDKFNFGTGDFTIDAWIYLKSYSPGWTGVYASGVISKDDNVSRTFAIDIRGTSTSYTSMNFVGGSGGASTSFDVGQSQTFYLNTWYHIAITRSGTTIGWYVNGARIGTYTSSLNFTGTSDVRIGRDGYPGYTYDFPGYIAQPRIIKGTALYTGATYTVPTAPVTPTAATTLLLNGMNAGIYDATTINDMETVGNAQVTTAVSKYGGSSVYFDGADDQLFSPSSANHSFGTGDFTIEGWLYISSYSNANQVIVSDWTSSYTTNSWTFHSHHSAVSQKLSFWCYNYNSGSAMIAGTTTLATGTWYHVAITRSGTSFRMFLNGTQEGSTVTSSVSVDGGGAIPWYVGGNTNAGNFLNGYLDDLRITKGVARYTANFTPPTQAFPVY